MIVEVHPHLGGLQLSLLDARHPSLQLFLFVEIVVSIQPVVVILLALIPDIVVPAVFANSILTRLFKGTPIRF